MGTDGVSTSTVFRTTSTTSEIPSSFSMDVYTPLSRIYAHSKEFNPPVRP
jgi:hypothetical protein